MMVNYIWNDSPRSKNQELAHLEWHLSMSGMKELKSNRLFHTVIQKIDWFMKIICQNRRHFIWIWPNNSSIALRLTRILICMKIPINRHIMVSIFSFYPYFYVLNFHSIPFCHFPILLPFQTVNNLGSLIHVFVYQHIAIHIRYFTPIGIGLIYFPSRGFQIICLKYFL